MKKKLIIIGAGGHAKVIADIAMRMKVWKDIKFLDDSGLVKEIIGLEVIGETKDAYMYKDEADFFVAIGNNAVRNKIMSNLIDTGYNITKLIHPSAIIGKNVNIDIGTVVMAGVVINSYSRIGKGCIINTSSSLDHDNLIEDYVHISPGTNLAGTVKVGRESWLGIGSVVSNGVTICNRCKVGAGGVVIRDIIEEGTYVGVPVKKL